MVTGTFASNLFRMTGMRDKEGFNHDQTFPFPEKSDLLGREIQERRDNVVLFR